MSDIREILSCALDEHDMNHRTPSAEVAELTLDEIRQIVVETERLIIGEGPVKLLEVLKGANAVLSRRARAALSRIQDGEHAYKTNTMQPLLPRPSQSDA